MGLDAEVAAISEVDVKGYDAIFAPGGLAPMVDMPNAPLLKQVVVDTYEPQAAVGAVCHGPVALLNATLSDVPFDLQTALTEQGALYQTVEPWGANSIADGNLVTGQNPTSAKDVAQKMIAITGGASR